jgi:hypothetical protein
MTGRRRGAVAPHDTSSRSTSGRPAEHDPRPAQPTDQHADGVGADVDAIDSMANRLDATRDRVEAAAATVRDVHLGPQSMGVIGSGFTDAAEAHVRHAEQQLARATDAVDQARQGTRTTAAAYRDTDTTSAAALSTIDTTTDPPTPHGADPGPPATDSAPPTPPHRPPHDGAGAGWHGEGDLHLTPPENTAANDFLARAERAEPEVTRSMRAISHSVPGSDLVGLDYRLKSEDSFKRKLATAIEEDPDVPVAEHLADMKDSVRYPMRIPDDSYTAGVQQAVQTLRDNGYESVTFKNTWDSDGYQGINSTWRDPHTGHTFEVQFHTPHSFDAKMVTHGLYEQARLPGVSPDLQRQLANRQNEIFSQVPRPPDAPTITLPEGGT